MEEVPTDIPQIEKTQEGIIADVGEAFLADSVKGIMIVWKKAVPVTPEISSDFWFVYSGENLKGLSGLKGRRVRITFVYEDDGYADFGNRRIYVPIVRVVGITDLGRQQQTKNGPRGVSALFFIPNRVGGICSKILKIL